MNKIYMKWQILWGDVISDLLGFMTCETSNREAYGMKELLKRAKVAWLIGLDLVLCLFLLMALKIKIKNIVLKLTFLMSHT